MTIGINSSGHVFDTSFNTDGILYSAASGVITSTTVGTAGHVLTSNGAAVAPTFQAAVGAAAISSVVTQVFTSSGTYTPTSGMKYCIIECVGGGGGGGGTGNSTAGNSAVGGGGGGGSYSRKTASAATIGASQTVTIPDAASGGSAGNNAGQSPAATTLGSICTANGGTGGGGNPGNGNGVGGAGGTVGTGDFSVPGGAGGTTINAATTLVIIPYGEGGSSCLGFGGTALISVSNTKGNLGQLYGGGGGGGSSFSAAGTAAGGDGGKGIVIITEYV